MLTIERVNTMNDAWLDNMAEYAKEEVAIASRAKIDIIKHSSRVWVFSQNSERLMLCGIVKGTWLGTGTELWVMLFTAFFRHKKTMFKFIRRALKRLIKVESVLKVHIDQDQSKAKRFAEFFGFRFVQAVGKYDEYLMRASWLQQRQ